jgi:hypothetical protein
VGCASSQVTVPENSTAENLQTVKMPEDVNNKSHSLKKIDPELEKNQKMRQEKNIADYDLTASLYKGGEYRWAEPVLIKVRNAVAISIEPLNEKDKEIPVEEGIGGYRELDTIDKIFDYIQKGLDEEAAVNVKYDKNYGYPKEMQVDYIKRGTDQYQMMRIRKFEIITKP